MKHVLSVLLACVLPLTCSAQDSNAMVRLRFRKSDVRTVIHFYQRLTDRPLYAVLDLQGIVTVEVEEEIGHAAAVELIRKTLLERYGIELRTTERGETLVGWSKDPKYPRRSDSPMTDEERRAFPGGRRRVTPESPK